jgi:hypothetical protein
MANAPSENERVRRRQLVIDGRSASGLGISSEALVRARGAAVERWTATIRGLMQKHNVDDPLEVLPEILGQLEEHAIGEARATAKVAAREEVRALLRKVML